MIVPISLVILGFVALIVGANYMVSGSVALAKKHNIPDIVIGLTIVALGTSAPELIVSILAALRGSSDIALGNVVGSNNINLFIILGASGVIFPMYVQRGTAWREIPISFLVAVLLLLLGNGFFLFTDGEISRWDSGFLLLCFIAFMIYIFRQTKNQEEVAEEIPQKTFSNLGIWVRILGGLAGLVIGGKLVVDNSVEIATVLGLSEKIIGLTVVALGTSLPELATSIAAAWKKNSDIAIGNVVGSNIFNLLLILSVSGLIQPMTYNDSFNTDLYILLGGTAFLFLSMFIGRKYQIGRLQALILLLFYLGYTAYMIQNA
ncbi:calcium/sodium antiporter [Capnocytophaga canimorsus]|uniref:calcium/sodium antiporter n=1 Tax=Capnocytophaga canimorsus TaxID=28188 RepID=UPI0037CE76C2